MRFEFATASRILSGAGAAREVARPPKRWEGAPLSLPGGPGRPPLGW